MDMTAADISAITRPYGYGDGFGFGGGSAPSTISLLNGDLAATYSNLALSVEKVV